MMDLNGIVSAAISTVNPRVQVTMRQSVGYGIEPDGTRIPKYITTSGLAQIQPLGSKEIKHMEELNISGILRKAYFHGTLHGLVRNSQLGGDLVKLPDNTVWLIVRVNEAWPDWCSVTIQQQIVKEDWC